MKKIFFIIFFLFTVTDCFSDPIESLHVNSSEISNYAVNEIIILDNEGVMESYKIESIDAGTIRLSRNIHNGFAMNVYGFGTMKIYPDFNFVAVAYDTYFHSIDVGDYVNDVTQYLIGVSNDYISPDFYAVYSFLLEPGEPEALILGIYSPLYGDIPIQNLVKIYDLVNGSYVSRGAGLTLRADFSYADINLNTLQILVLAGVIVFALASILSTKKVIRFINKT